MEYQQQISAIFHCCLACQIRNASIHRIKNYTAEYNFVNSRQI